MQKPQPQATRLPPPHTLIMDYTKKRRENFVTHMLSVYLSLSLTVVVISSSVTPSFPRTSSLFILLKINTH
jgi:hypothetical protein